MMGLGYGFYNGYGGGFGGGLWILLLLILIIVCICIVVKGTAENINWKANRCSDRNAEDDRNEAFEILNKRLASGEISEDEYKKKKKILEGKD